MPLYECEKCHVVENTAMGNFWANFCDKKPLLCTECDPAIAKWHGRFDRITVEEYERKYPGARRIEYKAKAIAEELRKEKP